MHVTCSNLYVEKPMPLDNLHIAHDLSVLVIILIYFCARGSNATDIDDIESLHVEHAWVPHCSRRALVIAAFDQGDALIICLWTGPQYTHVPL